MPDSMSDAFDRLRASNAKAAVAEAEVRGIAVETARGIVRWCAEREVARREAAHA